MADPIIRGTRTRLSVPFYGEFLNSERHLMRVGGRLDNAAITANSDGQKYVPAGTLVGRVRATEDLFGPFTTGDDEFYLTAFDVIDAARDPEVELIVVGKNFTVVPERLPGWDTLAAAQKTLVMDNYQTIKPGADS